MMAKSSKTKKSMLNKSLSPRCTYFAKPQHKVVFRNHFQIKNLLRVVFCKSLWLSVAIVFINLNGISQSDTAKGMLRNMQFNGYLKYMSLVFVPPLNSQTPTQQWLTDNLVHNRLNYKWFITRKWTFESSLRTRFFFGEMQKMQHIQNPNYAPQMSRDVSWIDLSEVLADDTSFTLHTALDRLSILATFGRWEIKLGRQRINWGTSMIWNPNDIFNAYSLFDFDYEERPGTDALSVKRYTGPASEIEWVLVPADSIEAHAQAIKYKFNFKGWDLQTFAGWQNRNWVFGGGWAGEIKGMGIRGESTWFGPAYSNQGYHPQLMATLDIDYTFSNSLHLQASYLFNSEGLDTREANYAAFFTRRALSAQLLSPTMHSLYFGSGFPILPMLSANLFSILNPSDLSFFFGPAFVYTLSNNFEVMFTSQIFSGTPRTAYGEYGSIHYLRFKYNF
jgi:hypothetical protein